jgi:hypothetical protein
VDDTTIPGLDPGVCLKVLRKVPATGEAVFLMGLMPGWSESRFEYHEMNEECRS